jgi:hypothetical protein
MKQRWKYLLILLGVLVLWQTVVLKPLKIFAVYLHELGHAAMALIFGMEISSFNVSLNESGYVAYQSKGWFSNFMVGSAGYLGSILFALLILYLKRTALKKFILGTLAIILLLVTLMFSKSVVTILLPILFSIFILALYMFQNEKLNDWVIDILGITCAAYAIYDTFVDTILLELNQRLNLIAGWQQRPVTDAVLLARQTHIPAIVWGIVWLVIALLAVNSTLVKTSRGRR